MKIPPFALERFFARYEFSARYLLSSSDCDGLAMSEVLGWADDELRALWDGMKLGYTESPGHPLLRAEVARLYDRVDPAEVVAFVPEEGIFAAMHCLLAPGDHVVCVSPAYQSLFQVADSLGCTLSSWDAREEEGWRFDLADLAALVQPDTRLIVVNFPHNPTGSLPTREEFAKIVRIASACGAYLFSDEMYRLLEQDPNDRLPSGAEVYERAVVLSGMSKTFGMAGARVGWLVTHDERLRARLLGFKDYLTICGSAPSELLAVMALRSRKRIVERHVERIRRNIAALGEFTAARPGLLAVTPPRAGSVCFPHLMEEPSAMEFAERVVREAGIMIVPSGLFGYGDRHIRLGLGREDFPQVLGKLGDYLDGRG